MYANMLSKSGLNSERASASLHGCMRLTVTLGHLQLPAAALLLHQQLHALHIIIGLLYRIAGHFRRL